MIPDKPKNEALDSSSDDSDQVQLDKGAPNSFLANYRNRHASKILNIQVGMAASDVNGLANVYRFPDFGFDDHLN